MELNIQTKFNVGQEVFICKPEWPFVEGKYVLQYVPDPQPYRIISVRTHTYADYTSVYYRLDGHQKSFKENWIYATLDDAVNCNCK